jgi:hypothetical protein
MEVDVAIEAGRLRVALRHAGAVSDPSGWTPGTGMATMRRRAADLAGDVQWRLEPDTRGALLCLSLSVPLPAESA